MAVPYSWLPGVDTMLQSLKNQGLEEDLPLALITEGAREALREFREEIARGESPFENKEMLQAAVLKRALALLEDWLHGGISPMINATGIVLHTNLGRAPLSAAACRAVQNAAGYCSLELDIASGGRGNRSQGAEELLLRLSGAEDCILVNNNAAALLLALDTLAQDGEVIVSRGELVEIGGSFRVPEIMEKSGGRMREVGTTNKTHLRDYQGAIGAESALILRVHPSNFHVAGFAGRPGLKELCDLAHKNGLPLLYDLGGGCFYPLAEAGIGTEPLVREEIAAGADLITISGDKLLGGPQAGIILGKKALIQQMKANPLARALRMDKLCLAALEATLKAYLDLEQAREEIPLLRMLLRVEGEIRRQGLWLLRLLKEEPGLRLELEKGFSQVGGGALPGVALPTWLVKAASPRLSSRELGARLRRGQPGVMTYIREDKVVFDLRTVSREEVPALANAIKRALKS